jgi:hypothetical protein
MTGISSLCEFEFSELEPSAEPWVGTYIKKYIFSRITYSIRQYQKLNIICVNWSLYNPY